MLEVLFYRLLGKSSTYKGNVRGMTSNHTCKDKKLIWCTTLMSSTSTHLTLVLPRNASTALGNSPYCTCISRSFYNQRVRSLSRFFFVAGKTHILVSNP